MIKVISFDLDSTLIDGTFDRILWDDAIPSLYAKEKDVSLDEAKMFVFSEYYKAEHQEKIHEWADITYWLKRLGIREKINTSEIEKFIKVYDDANTALSSLKKKHRLILSTLNSKETLEIKMKASGLSKYFDKTYCDDITGGKSVSKMDENLFLYIIEEEGVKPSEIVHIGDNPITDVSIPSTLGIRCILIDRKGKRKGEDIIHSLTELEEIL
ncbi:MAG: HAD family hydrolase [Candidatus Aenigmarchaeota archaeon]|nr:HAD family hydrolase [Candidatus Aenigmarchaeota archaeon]